MSAGIWHFTLEQGATFVRTLKVKRKGTALNLVGYQARMQIRPNVSSATTYISLTEASWLILGGVAGTIMIRIEATATAALSFDYGYYDLEIVEPGGSVLRLLQGKVTFSREVTR